MAQLPIQIIPQEEPVKPTGDSFIPAWHFPEPVRTAVQSEQPIVTARVYTEEEQEIITGWHPIQMGNYSELLDRVCYNNDDLLAHASAYSTQHQPRTEITPSLATAVKRGNRAKGSGPLYEAWMVQCGLRREWIGKHQQAWKNSIQQRNAAMLQWDQFVANAKRGYEMARNTPAPPQPTD